MGVIYSRLQGKPAPKAAPATREGKPSPNPSEKPTPRKKAKK